MSTVHRNGGLFARRTRMYGGAVVALTLIGAEANGLPITTWLYDTSVLQYVIPTKGDPQWEDYDPAPTVGASQLPNGIKLFGTGAADQVFSLTGADYIPSPIDDPDFPDFRGNRLVISGTGTIDATVWQDPQDYVRTEFGIGFDFTGGLLDFYKVETSFTLFDESGDFVVGVGSGIGGGFGVFEPGGYGVGTAFEDRFNSGFETARTIAWSVTFGFDWTGMAPDDTFNFSIPPTSIDIQALPEPGSAALFGAAGLVGLVRRRRR